MPKIIFYRILESNEIAIAYYERWVREFKKQLDLPEDQYTIPCLKGENHKVTYWSVTCFAKQFPPVEPKIVDTVFTRQMVVKTIIHILSLKIAKHTNLNDEPVFVTNPFATLPENGLPRSTMSSSYCIFDKYVAEFRNGDSVIIKIPLSESLIAHAKTSPSTGTNDVIAQFHPALTTNFPIDDTIEYQKLYEAALAQFQLSQFSNTDSLWRYVYGVFLYGEIDIMRQGLELRKRRAAYYKQHAWMYNYAKRVVISFFTKYKNQPPPPPSTPSRIGVKRDHESMEDPHPLTIGNFFEMNNHDEEGNKTMKLD